MLLPRRWQPAATRGARRYKGNEGGRVKVCSFIWRAFYRQLVPGCANISIRISAESETARARALARSRRLNIHWNSRIIEFPHNLAVNFSPRAAPSRFMSSDGWCAALRCALCARARCIGHFDVCMNVRTSLCRFLSLLLFFLRRPPWRKPRLLLNCVIDCIIDHLKYNYDVILNVAIPWILSWLKRVKSIEGFLNR